MSYVKQSSFTVLEGRGLVDPLDGRQWRQHRCYETGNTAQCSEVLDRVLRSLPLNSYMNAQNFVYQQCLGKPSLEYPTKRCGEYVKPLEGMTAYLNRAETQSALKAVPLKWEMCNASISERWSFDGGAMTSIIQHLALDREIPVLLYNGKRDILKRVQRR